MITREKADIGEGVCFITAAVCFVYLTTARGQGLPHMTLSLFIILFILFPILISQHRGSDFTHHINLYFAAMLSGFWVFNLFRHLGFVSWPLQHTNTFLSYAWLLYCHFVLALTVLTPLLLSALYIDGNAQKNTYMAWGTWNNPDKPVLISICLTLSALSVWLVPLFYIKTRQPVISGPVPLVLAICFLKAALTGITEEICFRGFLLHAAVKKYGALLGNIFQSLLYLSFHIFLGEGVLNRTGFLLFVLGLGLCFGFVTQKTTGIGWACMVHTATDMVVEWQNLL